MKSDEVSQRRVTSADVARVSGVSRATVSYVLNNDPHQTIPPETRERVLKAAEALGYRPFTPARILRAGHSQVVLAALPFEQIDPSIALNLKELETRLAARGMTLICHVGVHLQTGVTHPSSNITPSAILSYADETDPQMWSFLRKFQAPILPLLNNRRVQQEIGKMQAEHLLQRGRRRLVYAAPEREDVRFLSQGRLSGVRQVCDERSLPAPHVCVIPSSREEIRAVMRSLPVQHTSPWGICCYNDEVALAVIAALTDEGIAIPDVAAIIGCDNIPLAAYSIPPLTTIHFDREGLLDPLADMIVAVSQGAAVEEVPQAVLSIIERQST